MPVIFDGIFDEFGFLFGHQMYGVRFPSCHGVSRFASGPSPIANPPRRFFADGGRSNVKKRQFLCALLVQVIIHVLYVWVGFGHVVESLVDST